MLTVGLTGGIGSGKSAAAAYFSKLGVNVVDADWAARVVVQPGQPALKKIATHFSSDILLEDGQLNRSQLRGIIFNDIKQRRWLEQLLHPLIRDEIVRALAASGSIYTILESPLLIESEQTKLVNRVCVVDLPQELQITRACARDNSDPEQIRKIIQAQISRAERCAQADNILDNSGTLAELQLQVRLLHQKYLISG